MMAALLLGVTAPSALGQAAPFAGKLRNGAPGLTCLPQSGVRFCEGGPKAAGLANDFRVLSFDGQPLDADVTLPPQGAGPFPLLVLLHGLGNSKKDFEAGGVDPGVKDGLNNVEMAQRGYAVLNYTARGFFGSCGAQAASPFGNASTCPFGTWVHLDDVRYEVRDTQYLAGLLADQGIAKPDIGASGVSYGGAQSLMLAKLKNRIVPPSATSARSLKVQAWTSPNGVPMSTAVVFAQWPFSNLADALMPNGRSRVTRADGRSTTTNPIGVLRQQWEGALFLATDLFGQLAPPGADPGSDLTSWNAMFKSGEPYAPSLQKVLDMLRSLHSAAGIDRAPAPTAIASGWNDALFPVTQAVSFLNSAKKASKRAEVAVMAADIGHSRGQNKPQATEAVVSRGIAFLDKFLKPGATGAAGVAVPKNVMAWTFTCPKSKKFAGPFRGKTWQKLHRGYLISRWNRARTVNSKGGNSVLNEQTKPTPIPSDTPNTCNKLPNKQTGGVANYKLGKVRRGYTMIGMPYVSAKIKTTKGSPDGELIARLWDVKGKKQIFITQGVYRLNGRQTGKVRIQLDGNAWRFRKRHYPRFEILGSDAPTYRRSNNKSFKVKVSKVRVKIPTRAKQPK